VIAVRVEMMMMITCKAVFLPVNITLETIWMCNYVNYHITMLILFGSASLAFSLITVLLWLCNNNNNNNNVSTQEEEELATPSSSASPSYSSSSYSPSIRYCATWALTTAILSTGFEGPVIMFYLCVLVLIVHMMMERCIVIIFERHTVHPQDEIGDAAEGRRELGEEEEEEEGACFFPSDEESGKICSICLNTVTNGQWLRTRCNHSFHRECLQKWQRDTCPLCRQEVVVVHDIQL